MAYDFDIDVENVTEEVDVDVDGVRGVRGYSAYEVAVQNGFSGSKDEWLASLKGEKGDRGIQGEQGETGLGIESAYIDGAYCLNLRMTDGTTYRSQSLRGATGVSIRSIEIEDDYGLLITFTDGTTAKTTSTRGEKGERGYGIANAVLNQDYTLTLTFEDGQEYITPPIRGAQGESGDDYVLTPSDKTEIAGLVQDVLVETITGQNPVIVAESNHRYMCGEVLSLDFTPCENGICDVIFTSGSTVAVLTLPDTVRLPKWFDATKLETNTTYEINIADGIYGAVMSWT